MWNETPLAGILVELVVNDPGNQVVATAVTDELGQFVVDNFPPGSYFPRAHYPPGDDQTLFLAECPPFSDPRNVGLFEADLPRVCTFHAYREDLEIVFPTGGAIIDGLPTLAWNAYPNAASYRVCVSSGTPNEYGGYSYREVHFAWVTDTSWTVPQRLPSGNYLFCVDAYNARNHWIARVTVGHVIVP